MQGRLWACTENEIVGRIHTRATRAARKWMKRRASIEPTIGHLKSDHRLSRNHLKGEAGDHANVALAAAYSIEPPGRIIIYRAVKLNHKPKHNLVSHP